MSPEKQQELIAIYPELFASEDPNNLVTMFGFECRDGWYNLLHKLLTTLKSTDWRVYEECPMRVEQIKEKYGTLRFYMNYYGDKIQDAIHIAEAESAVTCEECGEPGKLTKRGGWYQTLCEGCQK